VNLFLALLHALTLQTSQMQPQLVMEKVCFHPDLLEPMSCHLSTRPRFAHQRSLNQAQKDERRLKTIFNHFRDKPARALSG
jgi:hypothetical protein